MRRLPRLRGSASALSSSTTSCPRTHVAAIYSSTTTAAKHTSAPVVRSIHAWQSSFQRRCLSTSVPRCDKQAQTTPSVSTEQVPAATAKEQPAVAEESTAIAEEQPAAVEESSYADELLELANSRPSIDTDLVYPRERVEAETTEEITDPDYVPAESGAALEEVGGLQDWWDRPGHWGESKKYVGFGPLDKVKDFAAMEVFARRAVVEALAIREHAKNGASKEDVDAALQALVGGDEILAIQGVELVAAEGSPVGVEDVEVLQTVWDGLVGKKDSSSGVPEAPAIEHQEAMDLIKAWGSEWKKATIQDPVLKFYIAKRLQRLTGHVIADAKVHGPSVTVGGIISAMARKPKPKKLAELLEKTGALADLPNVQVYPRRVTPIDKEQMVGRWKLIKKELEARDLPVTGHDAKHSKSVELKWASGSS